MIVGYPGETKEEFSQLCRFVGEVEFDHLGTFTYSDEEGTASCELEDKLEEEVINRRRDALMKLQAGISKRRNRQLVGRTLPLLVEGESAETEWLWQGRLESQAPRIDGVVYINDAEGAWPQPGDFRSVEITRALDYDLLGRLV